MRFTDRSITALKPKLGRYEAWEDGRTGLGVRVSPSGRKTWVYPYRFDGKPRRMTIGVYPALGLASARVQHSTAREQLDRGIDPGSLKVAQRNAERRAETVFDLIDEYLSKYARPKKRDRGKADERALSRENLPGWGRNGTKLALKLPLVTGQRRSEAVMVPWSEFDTDAARWDIPAIRAKNGHPHSVSLSPLALEPLDLGDNASAAMAALAAEQIDGWPAVDNASIDAVKTLKDVNVYEAQTANTGAVRVRPEAKPFDDRRARKAMRLAIDCKSVLDLGIDDVISRTVDVLLSFPKIVMYVVLISTVGPSRANIVAAVVLVAGPGIARLTRGLTLDLKTNDYVAAAQTRGESAIFVMAAEILPNARGMLIVDACMRMGYTIIAIGVLGFLGLGLPPPDPDWGGMVREATPMLIVFPHMALLPCLAIVTLVLGFNLLADGLQDLQSRA